MSFTGLPQASGDPWGRSTELVALAARVRAFAPDLQTKILRVGQLAGPETWQGRVADVFWEEMLDQVRQLDRMGDQLLHVAARLELRATELAGMVDPSTGAGDPPG